MLAVSTAWEDLYYHFVRIHKSLRKPSRQAGKTQWIQQTPALAANLARQAHTVRSLRFAVAPTQSLRNWSAESAYLKPTHSPGIGQWASN